MGPYLRDMIDPGLSPYTVKSTAAALAKLYGCPSSDFGVVIPDRSRAAITRSRGAAARDRGFSPDRNRVLVAVAECSGLRRSELACLTGDRLRDLGGGRYGILVDRGSKGGRIRTAPLVGPPEAVAVVVSAMKAAGTGHVFQRINSHADIHAMRARYAARVYAAAVSRRGEGTLIPLERENALRAVLEAMSGAVTAAGRTVQGCGTTGKPCGRLTGPLDTPGLT